MRLLVKLTDYLGTFVYCCHHLEREDHGMVGQVAAGYDDSVGLRKRGGNVDTGG